jgi:hypothetical protein
MASGDYYRAKAAELEAQAGARTDPAVRKQLTVLARGYARLGDQADLNNEATILASESPESDDARK